MPNHTKKPTLEQLRDLTARQQAVFELEKKKLARQMHDELSQKATVLALELSLLSMDVDQKPQARALRKKVRHLCALVNDLGLSIRSITNQLHPKILEEFGLSAALECLAKAQPLPCVFTNNVPEIALSPSVSTGLYNVVENIINSVLLPAGAVKMEISLVKVKGHVQLRVCGEHPNPANHLRSADGQLDWLAIEERVTSLGGITKLTSVREVGTVATIVLPETPSCEAAPF